MKKIAIALAMAGLMGGMADKAFAGDPDPAIGRLLDSLEYKYEDAIELELTSQDEY